MKNDKIGEIRNKLNEEKTKWETRRKNLMGMMRDKPSGKDEEQTNKLRTIKNKIN